MLDTIIVRGVQVKFRLGHYSRPSRMADIRGRPCQLLTGDVEWPELPSVPALVWMTVASETWFAAFCVCVV